MQLPFGTFSQLQYLFKTNSVCYITIWYDLAPTDFSKVFEQYQAHFEYPLGQVVSISSGYLQVLFQHSFFRCYFSYFHQANFEYPWEQVFPGTFGQLQLIFQVRFEYKSGNF